MFSQDNSLKIGHEFGQFIIQLNYLGKSL